MTDRSELRLWILAATVLLSTGLVWLFSNQWEPVLICGLSGLFMIIVVSVSGLIADPDLTHERRGRRSLRRSSTTSVPQNATLLADADEDDADDDGDLELSAAPTATMLDALLEALPEAAIIVARGRIVHSNRPAKALLGEHISGADLRLAIRHPAALGVLSADPLAGPTMIELVGLGASGQSWQLRAMPLEEGRLLAIFSDISAIRATERMRTDFVANASHELRTPLAAITGFIETLADPVAGADGPTRERFLAIMEREARRMQRLVDDLISLSRIEAEKYRLPDEPIVLTTLAEEVAAVLRDSQRPRGQDITPLDRHESALHVRGDRAQLSQLLHNLIDNALKYGTPGTPVRISVHPAPGSMVALSVSDEGEGIASEHLPRLTERFYRADPGRSRAMGGTGLGLAIVKHIIERHRGHYRIDSTPGKGTVVRVLLPQFSPPE